MCRELKWNDSYRPNRGKVLSREQILALKGPLQRYVDVDGDGITYRTLPGVHAKGAYFTRGSGHAKSGKYTEDEVEYQEVVDRLTSLGYVTLAPDLFKGKLMADPGLAQDMGRALDETRAVTIVKGAIDELRKLDRVTNRPVATIGFGIGGRVSLATALRGADVQATVLFYGRVETTREGVAPLKGPILGVFGGGDHAVPEKDVKLFEAALKEAGKDVKIVSYPGIGHCFMDGARADYEPEEAKDAWIQMRNWLAVKLDPQLPFRRASAPPAGAEPSPAPTAP